MKSIVSVIVPVYNVERWLDRTICSLINQTFNELELILVNDGSSDRSLEIIEKYAMIDDRIVIVDKVNEGLASARNYGLEKAKSDFVVFVDGDDWLPQDALEMLMKVQHRYDADVVFFPYKKVYAHTEVKTSVLDIPTGKISKKDWRRVYRRLVGPIGSEIRDLTALDRISTAWGKLYRRNIIDHPFQGYEINYPEDLYFNIRNLAKVEVAAYTEDTWYMYNKVNETSVTVGASVAYKYERNNRLTRLIETFVENDKDLSEAANNRAALRIFSYMLALVDSRMAVPEKRKIIQNMISDLDIYVNRNKFVKQLGYLTIYWRIYFELILRGKGQLAYTYVALLNFVRKLAHV